MPALDIDADDIGGDLIVGLKVIKNLDDIGFEFGAGLATPEDRLAGQRQCVQAIATIDDDLLEGAGVEETIVSAPRPFDDLDLLPHPMPRDVVGELAQLVGT